MYTELLNMGPSANITSKEFIPFNVKSQENTKDFLSGMERGSEVKGIVPFSLSDLEAQDSESSSFIFSSLSISCDAWKNDGVIDASVLENTGECENEEIGEITNFDFSMTLVMMMPFQVDPEKVMTLSPQIGLLSKNLILEVKESLNELMGGENLDLQKINEFANEISELKNSFEQDVFSLIQYTQKDMGLMAKAGFKNHLAELNLSDEELSEFLTDEKNLSVKVGFEAEKNESPKISSEMLNELKAVFQLEEILAAIKTNSSNIEPAVNVESNSKLETVKLKLFEYKELGFTKVSLNEKYESIELKIKLFKENSFSVNVEQPQVMALKESNYSIENKFLNQNIIQSQTPIKNLTLNDFSSHESKEQINANDKELKEFAFNVKKSEAEIYKNIGSEIRSFLVPQSEEKSLNKEKIYIWKNGARVEVKEERVQNLNLNTDLNDDDELKFEEFPTKKKTETGKRYLDKNDSTEIVDNRLVGLEKTKFIETPNASNHGNSFNIDVELKGILTQKNEEVLPSYVSKDVVEQIENKLLHMADKGVKQLTLELNPAHLGRVEVRMEMEKDQLNIQMKVESEEVRKVVEAQMTRLKESLELQNVHLAKTEVNVFTGDKSFMSNSNQNKEKRTNKNKNSFRVNDNAIDDVFVQTKEIRKYGYNTVEYTA